MQRMGWGSELCSYYTSSQSNLDQLPSSTFLFNLHTPLFIQTDSSGMNDGSSQYRGLSRRQSLAFVVRSSPLSSSDLSCGIDELLKGNVSVAF